MHMEHTHTITWSVSAAIGPDYTVSRSADNDGISRADTLTGKSLSPVSPVLIEKANINL